MKPAIFLSFIGSHLYRKLASLESRLPSFDIRGGAVAGNITYRVGFVVVL